MTRTRLAQWAALPALTLALTGCHVNTPDTPAADGPAAALSELPSLEDTKAAVGRAMDEIASAASTIVPGLSWTDLNEGSTGGCENPYADTAGQRYFFPNKVAKDVAVSEPQWSQIEAAARAAAAKLDATAVQVMQNSPGHHDVYFTGPGGVSVSVGYRGNLAISGDTGCRLPAADMRS